MTDRSRSTGDTLDVLGLVGFVSLASVGWLGGCLATSPTLSSSVDAAQLVGEEARRLDRVTDRIAELDADALAVLGAYTGLLDDFEARTPARSWWEGLVKVYIGDGLLRDFCLLLATGLSDADRTFLSDVLAPSDAGDRMANAVAAAAAHDTVLASRLALWGRRLVGEALGVVQGMIERPEIARLLAGAPGGGLNQAAVFAQLTAEHTRRMGRVSLAA